MPSKLNEWYSKFVHTEFLEYMDRYGLNVECEPDFRTLRSTWTPVSKLAIL